MALPQIEIPDYLSEPIQSNQPSPLKVLDDFAEQLTKQTDGLVKGMVNVAPFLGMTRYTFYLVVPAVNDYTDALFYVWNEKMHKEYPVLVALAGDKQEDAVSCSGAKALIERGNHIFNDSGTRSRVRQWIELSKERSS